MTSPTKQKRGRASVGDLIPPPGLKTCARAEGGSKKSHYRSLPKEFLRDGFTYRQIARENDAAIYEQKWSGCSEPSVCYEIIRIRRREGFSIGGRFIPPAEVYPRSEQWGELGWTLTDRDAAFAKLRELAKSRRSER
jgi:hypothetical protein